MRPNKPELCFLISLYQTIYIKFRKPPSPRSLHKEMSGDETGRPRRHTFSTAGSSSSHMLPGSRNYQICPRLGRAANSTPPNPTVAKKYRLFFGSTTLRAEVRLELRHKSKFPRAKFYIFPRENAGNNPG